MRSDKRSVSVRLTLLPGGGGVGESGVVSTTYGWQRVGGTTSHRIQSQALSELLNELERQVGNLESRFLEVLDILSIDILRPAGRLLSTANSITTREDSNDISWRRQG